MSLDNCCKQLKPSVSSSVSLWISGECWETCVFSLLWLYCVSHRLLRRSVTPVTPVQLWAHWDCDQAGAVITLSVPRSRHCQQQLHTAWSRLHSRHFSTHFHAGGKNFCKPSLHQEIKKNYFWSNFRSGWSIRYHVLKHNSYQCRTVLIVGSTDFLDWSEYEWELYYDVINPIMTAFSCNCQNPSECQIKILNFKGLGVPLLLQKPCLHLL